MVMTIARDGTLVESKERHIIPKERYVSREFFDLEMEKLWPRVWQMACREEEVPHVGDFLEYVIGDQSILITRSAPDTIQAFYNTCPHRGTRLAAGVGNFATGEIRCRYHAWRFELDGTNKEVVDRFDFPESMTDADVCLNKVKVGRWGGFVFINMDPASETLEEFLGPLPTLLGPFRYEEMRFRSYRTTLFEANWKTVVDSFNEGYHPQGTHPQMLTWYDDTLMVYESLGRHGRMGGESRKRRVGPSPRLGLTEDDYDEVEQLILQVEATSGLFTREDRERVKELANTGLPEGMTAVDVLDELRINGLKARGIDLSGMTREEILNGGAYHIFPNLLGPGNPGNVTLYRVRPNGLDPDSTLMDMWALEWAPPEAETAMPERKFYADWREKDWGLINNQDYSNYREIQIGMKSRGLRGLVLNPRQEANLLHMHQVIDHYLMS